MFWCLISDPHPAKRAPAHLCDAASTNEGGEETLPRLFDVSSGDVLRHTAILGWQVLQSNTQRNPEGSVFETTLLNAIATFMISLNSSSFVFSKFLHAFTRFSPFSSNILISSFIHSSPIFFL